MRMIHVLRKPLSEGTVAANTLKHGTGGINIGTSRIASDGSHMVTRNPKRKQHDLSGGDRDSAGAGMFAAGSTFTPTNHAGGRWPANVILQHLDGCRCEGIKKVPSNGNFPAQQKTASWKMASKGKALTPDRTYRQGGEETVSNWVCEPGCPVARLDEQSGSGQSPKTSRSKTSGTDFGQINDDGWEPSGCVIHGYGDTGGASRFYKQVGGKTDG